VFPNNGHSLSIHFFDFNDAFGHVFDHEPSNDVELVFFVEVGIYLTCYKDRNLFFSGDLDQVSEL